VKLVAVTGASNVTGYVPDIHRIARMAHAAGAQLLAHVRIDVRAEDDPGHLDFLAAAGHKAYAPFGSSFLYAPRRLCDAAPPYVHGGGTVAWVSESDAFYKPGPERHEGGTPNVAGAIALGASLCFLEQMGMEAIREHERALVEQAVEGLRRIPGVTVLGHLDSARRIGVLAFDLDGVPHAEVAARLDREAAIAVRNGCFCAHGYLHRLLGLTDTPALRRRLEAGEEDGMPGAVRPSLGIYNTEAEVQALLHSVRRIRDRRRREASGGAARRQYFPPRPLGSERRPPARPGPASARSAPSAPWS
jgi:selenocysteine lyase/cysteine desulfurase